MWAASSWRLSAICNFLLGGKHILESSRRDAVIGRSSLAASSEFCWHSGPLRSLLAADFFRSASSVLAKCLVVGPAILDGWLVNRGDSVKLQPPFTEEPMLLRSPQIPESSTAFIVSHRIASVCMSVCECVSGWTQCVWDTFRWPSPAKANRWNFNCSAASRAK